MLRFLALTVLAGVSCAEKYPKVPPYENELDTKFLATPSSLPVKTPSFTYDETDPGGYSKLGYETCDYDAITAPGTWSPLTCHKYHLYYRYETDKLEKAALAALNCSKPCFTEDFGWAQLDKVAKDFADKDYWVSPNSKQWMEDGKICGHTGHRERYPDDAKHCWHTQGPTVTEHNSQIMGRHGDQWRCKRGFTEQLWCDIFLFRWEWTCMQQYISPTKRAVMRPCLDTYLHYYEECPLFIAPKKAPYEPPAYLEILSATDWHTVASYSSYPDNICNPYSYYFPSLAKSGGATSSSTAAPSSSKSASSKASSSATETATSASMCWSGIMVLFLTLSVMVMS